MTRRPLRPPTLTDLRCAAEPLGIVVRHDAAAGCYEAEAPPGRCFPGAHHELVEGYADRAYAAEARAALLARLRSPEAQPVACRQRGCEWCAETASLANPLPKARGLKKPDRKP